MASRVSTVIHPVKDLAAAKAVYGALLGAEPIMDEPYYVGGGKLIATVADADGGNVFGLTRSP
jgi:hypothetical protein